MAERYIEKLERERQEVIDAIKSVIDWRESLDRAHNAVYKFDAFKVVDEKRAVMDAAIKKIEPLLAE